MKEHGTIIMNRTYQLSNRRCESYEDKASAFVRIGLTGRRASKSTVASRQALVSIVNALTRIRLKRTSECDEPIMSRRNQHLGTRWACASQKHSGVEGIAWLQNVMGKAGIDPEQRRSVWEFGMPTTLIVNGLADQVVVAMTSPIIRRRSRESMDMVVSGEMNGMGYCRSADYRNLCHSGLSFWNHISRIITTRRSTHQTLERKDVHNRGTPCFKSDGRNALVHNFRGVTGNGILIAVLDGTYRRLKPTGSPRLLSTLLSILKIDA